mgnify:FL=1
MSCKEHCQYPHKLKDKPENCTPEQIRECHGDEAGHPCAQTDQGEQKDNA